MKRIFACAAGVLLATTAASTAAQLELVTKTASNLTLTNGCVYAPSPVAQNDTWTFAYTNKSAEESCPLIVRLKERDVPNFQPRYLVGVYR